MKDEVAFVIVEEGDKAYVDKTREYKIYFDGHITGFRYECRIINYALPVLLKMQALEKELEEEKKYIKYLEKRAEELE